MRLRHIAGLLAVCGGLSLIVLTGCGRKPAADKSAVEGETVQATPVSVAQATTGSIRQVLTLSGSVEPWREVDVQCEVAGKVAWVGYDVGDRVSAGAALVRLDTALASAGKQQSQAAEAAAKARYGQTAVGLQLTRDETASAIRQAEKSLEGAQNRLAQAKTSAKLTETRVENAIAQARIGVNSARAQLADVKAGSRNQEIAQAQARVEQSQAALRLAKLNLERMQSLQQAGAVATAQVDAAEVERDTAQAQVRIAQQALDLAKEGARTEQVRLAELAVNQAEQALRDAESQREQIDVARREVRAGEVAVAQAEESLQLSRAGRRRVQATEQDLRAASAGVRQSAAGVTLSATQLRKHVVYAPISGQIAMRYVEPGEGASPGVSLLRIVNLDDVRVVAEASDLQVAQMRVGQKATVKVDALSSSHFTGVISDIAPQSGTDSRVFNVRLRVANPGQRLRAGMFARVEIITGIESEATIIARDALVERGEERVVYIVAGDAVKVRKVRIGAIEGNRVQVLSGLRSGDTVILTGQSTLAEGQKVQPHNGEATSSASQVPNGAGS